MLKQKSRMSQTRLKWKNLRSIAGITIVVLLAFVVVTAEREAEQGVSENDRKTNEYASGYLWENGKMIYRHVWPEMKFSWQIVLGTVIAFFGAAFGSVGGVGGGGIFVPMLTLIIGFDPKSSTAVSKCMITGAAGASVYYNLRLRHPTLDLPIIDYDLALLFQPMLVLGISIGVAFNVIFADWMVTVLLIFLFIGTSTKAFFKGVETWKKEAIIKQEAAKFLASSGTSGEPGPYKVLPGGPSSDITIRQHVNEKSEVSIIANVCWKELCILIGVWGIILFLQITKENYTRTCSMAYWILNLLQVLYLTILKEREPYSYWRCSRQRSRGGFTGPGAIAKLQVLRPGSLFLTPVGIPIAIGASAYEAVGLYTGKKVIVSRGQAGTCWSIQQLVLCCFCGILAGMVGGLLGLGGGFILGPLFLELGIPPQVSSATATFAMTFSSSMSVVQYYLLKRFPVPYAIYFFTVATVAALVGQHVVRKIVSVLGRASLIIFILAFTIFASAVSLGGVGIPNIIDKIAGKEYLGFEDICAYDF